MTTTISEAGAHAAAAATDRIPSLKSPFDATGKGYLTPLQIVSGLAYVDVASATTTDIGAAASDKVRITGTVTITGLGTVAAGTQRSIRFAAALQLTYNATSLILPGAANITTAANDTAEFVSLGSGNWICISYKLASGLPLPPLFSASNAWTGRETYSSSALNYNLAANTQATLLDFTTGADVTVAASKQADIVYYSDTYDIGSAGLVHLSNANVTAKSTSHSSSNLRGPTVAITNNGPGTTTGAYMRAIAGVGCTGSLLAYKGGVQTRSGISAAYSRQVTNDTDTSGTVEALDWWTSNTASATTANYGLLADTKLSVATSFIQYSSVGAGAFVTQKNSTNSADLFKISSAGIITECKGMTLNGVSAINSQMTFGTQVVGAWSNGTREFQAQAITTGDYWRIFAGGVGEVLKQFANGLLQIVGSIHAHMSTAIPAGGTAGAGLLVSSTSNFGVFFGSGAPSLSAAKGSLYLRSDGSATNNRAYINSDGGTTWTALTTAA